MQDRGDEAGGRSKSPGRERERSSGRVPRTWAAPFLFLALDFPAGKANIPEHAGVWVPASNPASHQPRDFGGVTEPRGMNVSLLVCNTGIIVSFVP